MSLFYSEQLYNYQIYEENRLTDKVAEKIFKLYSPKNSEIENFYHYWIYSVNNATLNNDKQTAYKNLDYIFKKMDNLEKEASATWELSELRYFSDKYISAEMLKFETYFAFNDKSVFISKKIYFPYFILFFDRDI